MKVMKEDISDRALPRAGGSTYRVPDGYFDRLPDRVMNRIGHEGAASFSKPKRRLAPAYYWVSAVAAVLILGWLGISGPFLHSSHEKKLEERLGWFVEFSKGDLNEGVLVEYWVDNELEVSGLQSDVASDLLDYYPDWIIDLD